MKIGRNDLCICGSKNKNKNCCNYKDINNTELSHFIDEALKLATTPSEEELVAGINRLELYLTYNIKITFKYNILVNLAMAYHNRGEDDKAIDLITKAQKEHIHLRTEKYFNSIKAVAISALGHTQTAASLIKNIMSQSDFNSDKFGILLIEFGKIFVLNNDFKDAIECLNSAVLYCKKTKDKWHEERASANLSFVKMLHSEDESLRDEGAEEIINNCTDKIEIGDLEGLSTNYCNIAIYYLNKNDFKGVLSYTNKDLYISKIIGNLRNTFISLRNLTSYYIILKQYKKARRTLTESDKIAKTLNDSDLVLEVEKRKAEITKEIKESISKQEQFDNNALCECKSGKKFTDCCIIGDVDPSEEMPLNIDIKPSEDIGDILPQYNNSNPLDFIFRKTYNTDNQLRMSWNQVKCHTGCYEISALPDMCSIYINSIDEQLSIIEKEEKNTINNVLNCLILSICATESFINQIAYFADSIKSTKESKIFKYPTEMTDSPDIQTFQQTTELSYKWHLLGNALCGNYWTPTQKDWDNFNLLIKIRNEFVHFKMLEYETIYPNAIKQENELIKRLPKEVILNDLKMPWSFRILSPSFALWSKTIAIGMIDYFKNQYDEKRKND